MFQAESSMRYGALGLFYVRKLRIYAKIYCLKAVILYAENASRSWKEQA